MEGEKDDKKLTLSLLFSLSFYLVANAQTVIYDNGGLATGSVSKSGASAPSGTQWSEVQNNGFETTSSNTVAGFGCQLIGTTANNRCGDDFAIPPGETWTITGVIVFAYQTGYTNTTVSPFVAGNLRIWSGFPEAPGSTIVFGDTTTNRLTSSVNSNLYRIFNSLYPSPGTPPGTTRIIWQNTLSVSPAITLGPGHYWIDFQLDAGANGGFTPTTTIVNARGTSIMNAIQKLGTNPWTFIFDGGNPTAAPDVPQDFPFKILGTINNQLPKRRSRVVDFDGDNKTDFVVARSASATSQTTWFVRTASTSFAIPWGLGVGFTNGDIAVPADYDGDGKTDIAVWRPGPPFQAAFYILRSSNSTLQVEVFGQTGDDPTVVDDYDGDGKADVAVYRGGASGGQSFFYYRGTLNNPSGGITFIPWGTGGDKPLIGDYDGDRKADPTVIRNSNGNALIYQRLSSGTPFTFNVVSFGLFSDKFVPGDYDGDNKTDLCVARPVASDISWYVLRSTDGRIFSSIWNSNGGFGSPASDFLVPGDYDGDNRTDFAVWRTIGLLPVNPNGMLNHTDFAIWSTPSSPENGFFFVAPSASALIATKWGNASGTLLPPDYPVANYIVR